MEIQVNNGDITQVPTSLMAVGVYEDQSMDRSPLCVIDRELGGLIQKMIDNGEFRGKAKELSLIYTLGKTAAERILLVGLGKPENISLEVVRSTAGILIKKVNELGLSAFSLEMLGLGILNNPSFDIAQALIEGIELALYDFNELKSSSDTKKSITGISIFVPEKDVEDVRVGIKSAQAIVKGVKMARDLVNQPSNLLPPAIFVDKASKIAQETTLNCKILDFIEMKNLGMGGVLGVAQGSAQPPKFLVVEHNAGQSDMNTIVLVGKGVTFDTGGISIKPADGMERMKSDMSGTAAVLGCMVAISHLNLPLHVVGLMPLVENMPSGNALRPGDVLTMMNGKTVEVINTDAEGRLILADALCYAGTYHPAAVVDIATLTGSRTIALGDHAMAIFTKDDALFQSFNQAGQQTHERVWRMPLFEEYADELTSIIADYKHVGGKGGGSSIAAMFLSKFTDYRWAHLDIAGLVTTAADRPYTPKGATGVGVRLLVEFLRKWETV